MCLAMTNTKPFTVEMSMKEQLEATFVNSIKPSMIESWNSKWTDWFVTTDQPEDERFPGKLKCTFFFTFKKIS